MSLEPFYYYTHISYNTQYHQPSCMVVLTSSQLSSQRLKAFVH